jgi:hypothetical protein
VLWTKPKRGYNGRILNHANPLEFDQEGISMAAYTCEKCGMSVGTMTCGKCNKELVHDALSLDDGRTVYVSKCPEGHGKVKSPMCCGEDMSCPV